MPDAATAENPTAVNPLTGLSDENVTAELFGKWFEGEEARERGEQPTADSSAAAKPSPTGAPTADASEVSEASASSEAAADEEAVSSEEAPVTYTSVEDFLSRHQYDPEAFQGLTITAKVDGVERPVPVKELLKSYQLESHFTQKSQAQAEAQRKWQEEQQNAQSAWTLRLQAVDALAKQAHAELTQEFANVDWNKLRSEEPGRFAAEMLRFQQRDASIRQTINNVQNQQAQLEQLRQQQLDAVIPQEMEKARAVIPAWRDQNVFKADAQKMQSTARELGFTDAEVSQIYDHRYMLALHNASQGLALQAELKATAEKLGLPKGEDYGSYANVLRYATEYLKLRAKGPKTLQTVRAAPPAPGPGTRVTRNPKAEKLNDAKARLSKNPTDADAAADAFQAWADAAA